MSNSASSIWRTIAMPLPKLRADSIRSNSARGSGAPVSACAVMCDSTSHSQQIVLHELAGQLDGVPLDALQSRHAGDVDARQQLMQAVAELVEQRRHFAVREQRLAGRRRGPEKLHVRYATGCCSRSCACAAIDRVVHPRAALLAFARVEVEVELADERLMRVEDLEEAHARMPGRRLTGPDLHAVDRFDDAEQPGQYAVLREILLHFLLGEREPLGLQFFGDVRRGPTPRRRRCRACVARSRRARRSRARRTGACASRDRAGTRARRRALCAIFGTSDSSAKFAYPSSCASSRRNSRMRAMTAVLSHSGRCAEVGRERCRCAVHQRAQRAVVRVLHDGHVARVAQRQHVAVAAVGLRGVAGGGNDVGGNAGETGRIGDVDASTHSRCRARCRRTSPTATRAPPARP